MLSPKRTKYRKYHRGRMRGKKLVEMKFALEILVYKH
jgi:ribosomal protein L16/L10AE